MELENRKLVSNQPSAAENRLMDGETDRQNAFENQWLTHEALFPAS